MTRFDLVYGLMAPLAVPLYLFKLWRKKRPIAPIWDRLGGPFLEKSQQPRIWVHSVSVGEALAARTIVKALEEALPGHEVVVSSSTETGRDVAARTYGNGRTFPCPLDLSGSVRKAFDSVNPALVVLMELEVWPNMLLEAARRNVPVAVVNGRLSEKAARSYLRVKPLLRGTLERIGLYCVQNAAYAERFKAIGVPGDRIRITGTMKYDAVAAGSITPAERQRARRTFGIPDDALVLACGSTHPTEEAALLKIGRSLRNDYPDFRIVIVPRHTNRADDLAKEIVECGWQLRRRSQASDGSGLESKRLGRDEALMVDTMGELGDVYRAADIAFLGGSLVPHGGQNMMEPAGMGLPVLYGIHTHNFTDTVNLLNDAGAGQTVRDAGELEAALRELIIDEDLRKERGRKGCSAIQAAQGATARNCELLKQLVS